RMASTSSRATRGTTEEPSQGERRRASGIFTRVEGAGARVSLSRGNGPSLPPAAPTPFIGREAELTRLQGFVRGGCPLVTVAGPPGIGRTRLLRRLVEASFDDGRDAVWCDLTGCRGPADLVRHIATALGADLSSANGRRSSVDRLSAVLAARGEAIIALD